MTFVAAGKEFFLTIWFDIIHLYQEGKKRPIRLIKLTFNSMHYKPPQRQSVLLLVYQVLTEKIVVDFKVLKHLLKPVEDAVLFAQMISEWFRIMNVKDKFKCYCLLGDFREL